MKHNVKRRVRRSRQLDCSFLHLSIKRLVSVATSTQDPTKKTDISGRIVRGFAQKRSRHSGISLYLNRLSKTRLEIHCG
jgi:hypothetical protein